MYVFGVGKTLFLCLSSVAVCQFTSKGDQERCVVVGTAKDMVLSPRSCSGGSLIVFRLSPDGSKLDHVHTVSNSDYWLPNTVDRVTVTTGYLI